MAGKTVRAVAVDIEDWTAALPRFGLPEAALLSLINTALNLARLDCQIDALCHVDKPDRNWEVATFTMEHWACRSMEKRLDEIAVLIVRAVDGLDVEWPSTAMH